jgi:methyl-accepting chemotaxis protein
MKIKVKLSLITIGILLVVTAGLSTILLLRSAATAKRLSIESQTHLAETQAAYWAGRENAHFRALHEAAAFMADYRNDPADQRRSVYTNYLHNILIGENQFVEVYSVWAPNALDGEDAKYAGQKGYTAGGQYAVCWNQESGKIVMRASSDVDACMAMINAGSTKYQMTEPFKGQNMGKDTYLFRLRVPVIDNKTKQVVAVVGCVLDYAPIQQLVLQTTKANPGISAMTVFSDQGFTMGCSVASYVGKTFDKDWNTYYGADGAAVKKAITDGNEFHLSKYSPAFKANLQISFVPARIANSNASWSIMIGTSDKIIMADVYAMVKFSIILAVILLIVVVFIMYFGVNKITSPIVKVADTLKEISEGDGDLTKTVNVNSKDEVGDLAKYFNETIAKIRKLVVTVKGKAGDLTDIGNDLASSMTETAAAINEITANIHSIKERAVNQSASVTETGATMEQITLNIQKLNENINVQSESVAQASSAIEEMLANIQSVTQTLVKNNENVKALSAASDAGHTGLQDVSADIQEISKQSAGLLEINAVIENIASQTNLLSMNAAIEAALAGEAGKGFAVVADEIRKLAESSNEQSKTISAVLKKITESIETIMKATDAVLSRFEDITAGVKTVEQQEDTIRNAMEEQMTGSKQILDGVAKVNEITTGVKNGAAEMLEGSQQVITESHNLEAATQEITNGMNEMATGAEQINTAVNQVNESAGKNKDGIDVLVTEVSKFKVE